jgi:polyphosphate kinase 2
MAKKKNKKKSAEFNGGTITQEDASQSAADSDGAAPKKMKSQQFEKEMTKLQVELVRLQSWVQHTGARVIVVFEGRDAAGKGGVIKRISERVSPRVFRIVALPAPTEREKSQLYMQRYLPHFPAAGEIMLFDRSWYNRAGVERVMGFCTQEECESFLQGCPRFEEYVVRGNIILLKYFFDVSQEEQERRFLNRINDPLRQWKLSPMDLESYRLWWDYTKAYDRMLAATDTELSPWYIVKADDKRRARLNCIAHMLSMIPYKDVGFDKPELPKRKKRGEDVPETIRYKNRVPEVY